MQSSFVENILNQVFAAKLSLVNDPQRVPLEDQFWVISGDKFPRWIIPRNPAHGLPVLKQWRPYGISSSLKWAALKWIYSIGQLHQLPNVKLIGIRGVASSPWKHLGCNLPQSLVPNIYIGTPGTTQKAVATLIDRTNKKIVGVAKVPLGTIAQVNILREAEVLRRLESEYPGVAPQCLFTDLEKGFILEEAIPGRPLGRDLTQSHIQWLSKLHHSAHTTSIQAQAKILAKRATKVTMSSDDRLQLVNALQALNDPTSLPMTWVHGDFAPWNLKWCNNKISLPGHGNFLGVIDWEDAKPNGLPLYDLFHHQYIQAYLFNSRNPVLSDMWKNPIVNRYLRSLEITRTQFDSLALYYLTNMWIQSIECSKPKDANFFMTETLSLLDRRE